MFYPICPEKQAMKKDDEWARLVQIEKETSEKEAVEKALANTNKFPEAA